MHIEKSWCNTHTLIAVFRNNGKYFLSPMLCLVLVITLVPLKDLLLAKYYLPIISLAYLSLRQIKINNTIVLRLVILAISLSSSSFQQYHSILEGINKDLYLEPISVRGQIKKIKPGGTRGSIQFSIMGFIGENNILTPIHIISTDLPQEDLLRAEVGNFISCKLNSSDIKTHEKTFGSLVEFYTKLNIPTLYLNRTTLEYKCQINTYNSHSDDLKSKFNTLNPKLRFSYSLLRASCLGEKGQLETWVKDLFKATGLYHLLVVSGFHLGLLLLLSKITTPLISYLLPTQAHTLPLKNIQTIVAIILCTCFLLICETAKPLLRASIIAYFLSLSSLYNRSFGIWIGLLWSLIVLMLIYPFCFLEPGVQLSYGAITGVLLGNSIHNKIFKKENWEILHSPISRSFYEKIKSYLFLSFCTSLGAFIFVSPIQYFWFGTFSPYSLLFNVLFAPIFSCLVIMPGFILLALIYLNETLGIKLLSLYAEIIIFIIAMIDELYSFLT